MSPSKMITPNGLRKKKVPLKKKKKKKKVRK